MYLVALLIDGGFTLDLDVSLARFVVVQFEGERFVIRVLGLFLFFFERNV